jgi:hypothetical protein
MVVFAIVAAFLGELPRAMLVIVIIIVVVVVVFSDELSDEKVHDFIGIHPERRYMRDLMINLADVPVVLVSCVSNGAQGDAASDNEAASEGASR